MVESKKIVTWFFKNPQTVRIRICRIEGFSGFGIRKIFCLFSNVKSPIEKAGLKKIQKMATLKLKLSVEQLLELIRQLSFDDQVKLVEKLNSSLCEIGKEKSHTTWSEKAPVSGAGTLPPLESLEEWRQKYALKEEQLEPLVELFKDAPTAEELCKMLKP